MTKNKLKRAYICTLPDAIQADIKAELIFSSEGLGPSAISAAMSGRICDLEEVIDINKYIEREAIICER